MIFNNFKKHDITYEGDKIRLGEFGNILSLITADGEGFPTYGVIWCNFVVCDTGVTTKEGDLVVASKGTAPCRELQIMQKTNGLYCKGSHDRQNNGLRRDWYVNERYNNKYG